MPPNPDELDRLRDEKQDFFLPYYREIVNQHPGGISAADVKALVAEQVLERFGIDIFDVTLMGSHTRGTSRASQWANNLVSNEVLDEYMLVVRSTRATLYPGAADNSRGLPPPGTPLTDGQATELDNRIPTRMDTGAGSAYRRSPQLAERVRGFSGRACVVGRPTCVVFDARDGRRYVEIHHIVPMAMQGLTALNLDRTTNMAPLCPGCHAAIHRGNDDLASALLIEVLRWFESVHPMSFRSASADLGFDTTPTGLLRMYGSDVMPD